MYTTHKENIKKTKKTITAITNVKKLSTSKYSIERIQKDSIKNHPEVGKSGQTNSGNLVELLWHKVE